MNILVFNQPWFVKEWRDQGHRVVVCGLESCSPDVVFPGTIPHLDRVFQALPEDFRPDAIVYHDNSFPLLIDGIADSPVPTLFYSIDAHHHINFHKYLGHLFDVTLVAQKDYLGQFETNGVDAQWMPLWAPRFFEPTRPRQYGAVFVGNLNPDLNPERVLFFKALQKEIDMQVTSRDYGDVFPFSDIVVNQTVKGDLNFRVFEGMMCGALMLTEATNNGLLDLFEAGKHLITYEKNNVQDAAAKIRYYLNHLDQARSIAESGRQLILEKHGPSHRADFVLQCLKASAKRKSPIKNYSMMFAMSIISNTPKAIGTDTRLRAITLAMESARLALGAREPLNDELSHCLIATSIMFDRLFSVNLATKLLEEFIEVYPEEVLFRVATIHQYLKAGSIDRAKARAEELQTELPVEEVLKRSEEVIGMIMSATGLNRANLHTEQQPG